MSKRALKKYSEVEINSSMDHSEMSLMRIEPFRHSLLRQFVLLLPWVMLVSTPIVIRPLAPLRISNHQDEQLSLSSIFITTTLALFGFQVLMQRISTIFERLWQRGVIINSLHKESRSTTTQRVRSRSSNLSEPTPLEERYRHFVKKTEDVINGREQWILPAICITVVLWWCRNNMFWKIEFRPFLILDLMAAIIIAAAVGLMIWRMIIIGVQVWRLPGQFDLATQVGHSDQCGGLEPLGSVCLWNAIVIAIAALLQAIWLVIFPLIPSFRSFANYNAPIYKIILVVLIVLSFISFFLPLWEVHRSMVAKKTELEIQLDVLSQSIDETNRELLNSAVKLEPADGEKRLKKMELMRQIYSQNQKIPTWPINVSILSKFIVSQSIPVLSSLGIIQKMLSIITNSL